MACPTVALSAEEIRHHLEALPHWKFRENALERLVETTTYLEGLAHLNAIAQLSEGANHHPDLSLGWRKLTVRYWTHTAQGVTGLDFDLARQVEELLTAQ